VILTRQSGSSSVANWLTILRTTKLLAACNSAHAAYIENNAIGCYDRIINSLVLLLLRYLGIASSICFCLGSLWDHTTHLIKTAYGTSSVTYCNTTDTPLFSPSQGSTTGPPFWIIIFLRKLTPLIPFWPKQSHNTMSCRKAQHWEKILFSTRGAINTSKSHWYILSWNWKQGKPSLSTIHNTPTSLSLTSGYNKHPSQIPRINPSVSYRTLGVYRSSVNNWLCQMTI